jgi:hypothetical protein
MVSIQYGPLDSCLLGAMSGLATTRLRRQRDVERWPGLIPHTTRPVANLSFPDPLWGDI